MDIVEELQKLIHILLLFFGLAAVAGIVWPLYKSWQKRRKKM